MVVRHTSSSTATKALLLLVHYALSKRLIDGRLLDERISEGEKMLIPVAGEVGFLLNLLGRQ